MLVNETEQASFAQGLGLAGEPELDSREQRKKKREAQLKEDDKAIGGILGQLESSDEKHTKPSKSKKIESKKEKKSLTDDEKAAKQQKVVYKINKG